MASPKWEAVEALQERFNDQRAELHREHPDRWIVLTDGGVVAEHDDERAAFMWAFEELEPGTFVVDQATEHERVLTLSFNAIA
jgi:hypothetical protein